MQGRATSISSRICTVFSSMNRAPQSQLDTMFCDSWEWGPAATPRGAATVWPNISRASLGWGIWKFCFGMPSTASRVSRSSKIQLLSSSREAERKGFSMVPSSSRQEASWPVRCGDHDLGIAREDAGEAGQEGGTVLEFALVEAFPDLVGVLLDAGTEAEHGWVLVDVADHPVLLHAAGNAGFLGDRVADAVRGEDPAIH